MAKLNEGISQIKKGSALETMYNRFLTGMEQASHETLPDLHVRIMWMVML